MIAKGDQERESLRADYDESLDFLRDGLECDSTDDRAPSSEGETASTRPQTFSSGGADR